MLGAVLAVLSAITFALNNAAARRGVVTGTPIQGMAITVPLGVVGFLLLRVGGGQIGRRGESPPVAAAWMAGVGVMHFIFGRYCNYRASQAAGVNLTGPVVQLQVIVTLVLAVVILHEPCTVLQMIGGVFILAGALITQHQPASARAAPPPPAGDAPARSAAATPVFVPHNVIGVLFASLAALGYGTSPILARTALAHTGVGNGILGGLIAYVAATAVVALALLWPPLRRNAMAVK